MTDEIYLILLKSSNDFKTSIQLMWEICNRTQLPDDVDYEKLQEGIRLIEEALGNKVNLRS